MLVVGQGGGGLAAGRALGGTLKVFALLASAVSVVVRGGRRRGPEHFAAAGRGLRLLQTDGVRDGG